jgi:DNA replication ATP-dependent helicase Dna2
MGIELWIGHEYETAHEMKALSQFLTCMFDTYGDDDRYYLVLAGFYCQGEEIDLAVLKRDGIVVIELKDAGDPISGGENGPWTATRSDGTAWTLNAGRHRNPYQQARERRFAMIHQLDSDVPAIMPQQRAQHQRLDHVSTVVALCPAMHPDTHLSIPEFPWFDVVGLDELPQVVYFLRSPSLDLTRDDLVGLVRRWGLKQVPLAHFVPSNVLEPAAQPAAAPTASSTTTQPTAATPALGGLPVPPQPTPYAESTCPVCQYQRQPCEVPAIRGIVRQAIVQPHPPDPRAELEILGPDDQLLTLHLTGRWADLAPDIIAILDVIAREGDERHLNLAAYHLSRLGDTTLLAGPDSLVILEPDWLINVTALTQVEYCPRQYLISRFQLIQPNLPMTRGAFVHRAFEQLVKTPHDENALTESLRRAGYEQAQNMAILNVSKVALWDEVRHHYDRLKAWAKTRQLPHQARSETFLLAPQLGMKGRIDAVWPTEGGHFTVGELKTGRSYGAMPRPGHALQVGAYSLMTAIRSSDQPAHIDATLLYTGNQTLHNSLNVARQVELTSQLYASIVSTRNLLVRIDYLAHAPFELERPNKCWKCRIGHLCEEIAVLLQQDDPRPTRIRERFASSQDHPDAERQWFRTYTDLLMREYRAVKERHASLWRMSPEQRSEQGTTVVVDAVADASEETESGSVIHTLIANNQSELREEDRVLISGAGGPLSGLVAEGTVRRAQETGLAVELKAPLEFASCYVDRYVSETLLERDFAAPFYWLQQPPDYRDLVTRLRTPRFLVTEASLHFPPQVNMRQLNPAQLDAVRQALRMQDYLLIHGPPGSGKTMLVVAIVRELLHRGQRVLLAAGTNTAVDNMLKELKDSGYGDHLLRLGSVHRTDPILHDCVPEALADSRELDTYVAQLRHALISRPVVATTSTSWLQGAWDALYQFNVAIVDEAAQLTVPATLGPLRLARSFILIGDHMQLPAVVLSEPSRRNIDPGSDTAPRLSDSLFAELYANLRTAGLPGIVKLNEQYRMNEEICAIPRQLWYDDDLRPATSKIAKARLALLKPLSADDPLFPLLDPERPVIFADQPWAAGSGGPRTNRAEAQLVHDIVRSYLAHGLSMDGIGIIAPFRAQVSLIRRVLEATLPDSAPQIRSMVDTVDRFQGQQRELIVISLATYGDFVHDLLRDERRLNVALTRARHKLIIIGDASVLKAHPVYYSLIRHCTVIPAPPSG